MGKKTEEAKPKEAIQLDMVLEEASAGLETSFSSAQSDLLLSEEGVRDLTCKVIALEALLSLSVKDCSFKDFLREVLMIMIRAVKCEAGSLLEVDHKSNNLFFRAVVGRSSDRVANFVIPIGQGVVGFVAESKKTLVVDNVPQNTVHLKSIEKAVDFEAHNLIAIPILIRGDVYGVIELLNRIDAPKFSPQDVELLNYLGAMAAKTIETRMMIAWKKGAQGQVA